MYNFASNAPMMRYRSNKKLELFRVRVRVRVGVRVRVWASGFKERSDTLLYVSVTEGKIQCEPSYIEYDITELDKRKCRDVYSKQ
jgi:hypothetical protein